MDDFNLVEWIIQDRGALVSLAAFLYAAGGDMLKWLQTRYPMLANFVKRAIIGGVAAFAFITVLSLINDAIHEPSVPDEILEALTRIENKHQKDMMNVADVQVDIIFKEITSIREELNLVKAGLLAQRENIVNHIIIDHDPEKEETTKQQPGTTPPIP